MSYSITLLSIQDRRYLEQFPTNHAEDVFKKYTYKLNATKHLFVEKKGDDVYYTYLRRLNTTTTDYFGFCFVFKGEYIENIKELFDVCEELIVKTVKQGELLQGSLPLELSRNNAFETKAPEVKRVAFWFDEYVKSKTNFIIPFTTTNDDSSSIDVSISKANDEILFAIRNYNSINYYFNNTVAETPSVLTKKEVVESKPIEIKTEETISQEPKKPKKTNRILIFICCILLFVVSIAVTRTCSKKEAERKNQVEQAKLAAEKQKEEQRRQQAERERLEAERLERERLEREKLPEIIKIEIANTMQGGGLISTYGELIYSRETKFLKPRITYKAYDTRKYKLDVKWIKSNGSLKTGDSSPAGYSQSEYYQLAEGFGVIELNGWGNNLKGNWKAGTYAIEIWCKGTLLARKNFEIHKKGWF